MTLNEFKHFLDGFICGVHKRPTEEQWSLICAKLASVDAFNAPTGLGFSAVETQTLPHVVKGNGTHYDSNNQI
jgi:hypothetical protein